MQAAKDVSNLPPSERDFGIVFQSYALFPNLTIEKNIAFGLENTGRSKRRDRKAGEGAARSGRPARSGQEIPRAACPAASSSGSRWPAPLPPIPGLLLLDEPLSALDAKVRVHLRHEIKELQRKLGVTTVMVTHDQEEALAMADRIVVMNHGVIEQIGSPTEVYREPANLFVADFIGEMNQVNSTVPKGGRLSVRREDLCLQGS